MSANNRQQRDLISASEVAQILGITVRHVRRLPIRRIDLGHRSVRYRVSDVEQFITQISSEQIMRVTDTRPTKMTIRDALGAIKSMTGGTIQCLEHPEFRFTVNPSMRDGAFTCNEETHSALGNAAVVQCAIYPYFDNRLSPGAVEGNATTIEVF